MSFPKCIITFFSKTLPHALADFFKAAKADLPKIAMAIGQGLKMGLESGALNDVAQVLEAVFPNVKNIPTEVVAKLQKLVPKIFATELEIDQLPEDATEEQFKDFAARVLAAWGAKNDHSKLYSTLSGSVYVLLRAYTGQASITWYEALREVEEAFQAYKNSKADDETADVD